MMNKCDESAMFYVTMIPQIEAQFKAVDFLKTWLREQDRFVFTVPVVLA
jgi:hypothetical protein